MKKNPERHLYHLWNSNYIIIRAIAQPKQQKKPHSTRSTLVGALLISTSSVATTDTSGGVAGAGGSNDLEEFPLLPWEATIGDLLWKHTPSAFSKKLSVLSAVGFAVFDPLLQLAWTQASACHSVIAKGSHSLFRQSSKNDLARLPRSATVTHDLVPDL